MKLIIAEKPSVARTLASFLSCNKRHDGYFEGKDYIITYAFGHLVGLYDMKDYDKSRYGGSWKQENFPFIPADKFRFKVDPSKTKQFKIIEGLLKRSDVDLVINATDNDREGELIAFLILFKSSNKKPVKRILINEWTPEDIKKGMANLKTDDEMRNLQAAGYARLITDWLIGINFTSIATLKYSKGKVLNIGRVILPTVKLIYDREKEIENFSPKTFYELESSFKAQNGNYKGKLYYGKNETRFDDKSELEKIIAGLADNKGQITRLNKKKTKEYPQKLFSLTTLQGYISSKYTNFTADKVLKICQSLYEGSGKGGFITYPRTDSTYLEESLKPKVKNTLDVLTKDHPLKEIIKFTDSKRIFDSKKVDSHSAIIPTYLIPEGLSRDEQLVYNAIRDRFLMAFMPPAEFENTEINTRVAKWNFITKGRVLIKEGYLALSDKNTKDSLLPEVEKHEIVHRIKDEIKDGKTSPPKHYTEETILKAMKNCGQKIDEDDDNVLPGYSIGTSATRADVLKKILDVGYVKKYKKNYHITNLGKNLVEIFPVKELFDVDYTGKLEKKLYDIQMGSYDRKDFLNEICHFVYSNVNLIKRDYNKLISDEIFIYNTKKKAFIKQANNKSKKK